MRYFIDSNYINAWSVKKGLNLLGLDVIYTGDKKELLPLTQQTKMEDGDTLFFADERGLMKFYEKKEYKFFPRDMDESFMDDKFKFAQFLETIGEIPVPYCTLEEFSGTYPIYFKAKHSWVGDMKLPRGYIVKDEKEKQKVIDEAKKSGYDINCFFYQKLLKSPFCNNISVSGFYDYRNEKRDLFVVTRKVAGDDVKISTGCVIETIEDPERLMERTEHILKNLKYTGPFEMEFFYEEDDDKYYVLELNPRFWMQHGIFIESYDNGVIKRYLELDKEEDWIDSKSQYKHIFWVDAVAYYRDRFYKNENNISVYDKVLKEHKDKVLFYPDKSTALKYLVSSKMKTFKKKLFK